MAESWEIYADWNPWHGCTKISQGCKYCYVYCQDEMYGSETSSSLCRKTANFGLIDYKIGRFFVPQTIKFEWKPDDYHD
ncbi:MAG: phage Gp37/Gp68 family protein [Bacteroidales bacterium]|nr:phage Gp37/Gp68 family protein [Bacteroidales bacterium]